MKYPKRIGQYAGISNIENWQVTNMMQAVLANDNHNLNSLSLRSNGLNSSSVTSDWVSGILKLKTGATFLCKLNKGRVVHLGCCRSAEFD